MLYYSARRLLYDNFLFSVVVVDVVRISWRDRDDYNHDDTIFDFDFVKK